jgi:biotin transport system substrate-specific component
VMKNFNDCSQVSGQVAGLDYSITLKNAFVGSIGVVLFIGLTFLGSLIRIPLQPVPITLQTMFVLLAGAVLGSKRGSIAECSYVALGVIGIPLFSGFSSGIAVLAGPTGGYIAAFIITPLLIGRLINRFHSLGWHVLVFTAGAVFILALGALHLTLFYTHSVPAALTAGVIPFIPGEIFKIAAATSIYRSYSALARYRRWRS